MEDAIFKWAEDVSSSEQEADSLHQDVRDLEHQLTDLVHSIRDLGTLRFDDSVEDYEVLEKARGLWDLVSGGVQSVRESISDASSQAHDLRRAVEFYKP